ncbi:MAG TPA: DUF3105 domain-containing protein [Acidimicrobiales bacterium]|nr:DUF3105 domain-containing protein [Acidimicrobiales bacterium]
MRRTRLLGAVLALAVAVAACGDDDEAAEDGIPGVETIRIPPYEHTRADVDYDRSPPAGGPHGPSAAPCAFFDQVVPDELLVHTMEHGAVWLAYSPSLSAADAAVIRGLTEDNDDVVAAPYPDLGPGEAVVATSWGRQLRLDAVDDPRLERFVATFRNRDEAPEKDVGCEQP